MTQREKNAVTELAVYVRHNFQAIATGELDIWEQFHKRIYNLWPECPVLYDCLLRVGGDDF